MLFRLWILVLTSVAAIAAAVVAVGADMYISQHDLAVLYWIIGVGAVVSVAVAMPLAMSISRSSARLRSTARAIGEGRIVPAEEHEGTEFAAIASELAETSERLARAREEVSMLDASRRELVAWISHDLRTPLASLRAMGEALEDGLVADPDRYHRQISAQVDTISSMVDDLFELSKIQSGTLRLTMERLPLLDLISDAVAELHALAAERSVTLTKSWAGDLTVWGDARELARVIGNLLINAIQHSPPGSEILISAQQSGEDYVAVSVIDAGGGIPEEDLGRVFEAGWRGSEARTPDGLLGASSGAGLGLAIVHGIVRAHCGEVSVRNVPGGCRFNVTLPRHFTGGSPSAA